MTDEYAQAGTAAKRLTDAGFPAVRASAGYPAYCGGGDEGLDNDSVIVWLHARTAERLAAELAVLQGLLLSGRWGKSSARADVSDVTDEVLRDILLLLDRNVPLAVIAQWTDRERFAACEWASLAHLRASDNPVRTVDEPWFVKVAAGAGPEEQGSEWEAYLARLQGSQRHIDQDHSISLGEARREIGRLHNRAAVLQASAPQHGKDRDGSRGDAEVAAFAGECLDVAEPEDGVPGPGLLAVYKAYGDWAQRHGCMAMALSPFHAALRQLHVSEQTDNGARFPGLRLRGRP